MSLERLTTTAAAAVLLAAAAFPFVVLFPDPPAFGPESLVLAISFATGATLATAWRADRTGRRRILRRTGVLFGVTAATTLTNMALHGGIPLVPTLDLLPWLFGLDGEDADTAILFEAWCELWLTWVLLAVILIRCLPRRPAPVPPAPGPWHQPVRRRPWNAATVLLWAVGWCAMAGTVARATGQRPF